MGGRVLQWQGRRAGDPRRAARSAAPAGAGANGASLGGAGARITGARRGYVALAVLREIRLLHDLTRSRERPPDPDLLAAIECAGAHDRAIGAVELPRAVHLAVEVEAAELHDAIRIVLDVRDGSRIL